MANKKNNTNNNIVTKSKLYNKLANEPAFNVRTEHSTQAGVKVFSRPNKKGTTVEIVLPSIGDKGDSRVVRVTMTGRQIRALYETLERHYSK